MYAEVIIETAHKDIDKIFHYRIPESMENLQVGMRVKVPFGFGNKKIEGYVIGFAETTDIPEEKIKSISEICDSFAVFTKETIELARWMREKYYCTMTECLQCVMPSGVDINITKSIDYVEIDESKKELFDEVLLNKKLKVQAEVLKLLLREGRMKLVAVKEQLAVSKYPIEQLVKKGLISIVHEQEEKQFFVLKKAEPTQELVATSEQKTIIDYIEKYLYITAPETFLIHGVTGSGKTEVYLQLIKKTIAMGKSAIVLVPEISLTPQTVDRFTSRFGEMVAVTHSKMSLGERIQQWNRARTGKARIMIGPRSAVFAPFENLGLIIIDEEHENTYKSETTPKYHAREVAQKRCELTGAKLILGSATPSLESYFNAQDGKIHLLTMKHRARNNPMPQIDIVDMRIELENGNRSIFSEKLREAMEETLKKGEQIILFLNRRGYSTFVSCRKCGYVAKCTNCNISYTYHKDTNKLVCHYCGKEETVPKQCPDCGSKYIKYFGVGTQKVEDETKHFFPNARVARMDMDTTTKKNSHEMILSSFAKGDTDILIGTQMIAKGHDFSRVTLVGVIAADVSLNIDDYRGSEITFQILTQVSGRAGRADLEGKVYIQTYSPESYAINYAKGQDYESFYKQEIAQRNMLKYPPYSNIFVILFTGENEKSVIISAYKMLDILNYYNKKGKFVLLGPVPANISKIKNVYRWKIIAKCEEEERLKNYVVYCTDKFKVAQDDSNVSIHLSMNPMVSI